MLRFISRPENRAKQDHQKKSRPKNRPKKRLPETQVNFNHDKAGKPKPNPVEGVHKLNSRRGSKRSKPRREVESVNNLFGDTQNHVKARNGDRDRRNGAERRLRIGSDDRSVSLSHCRCTCKRSDTDHSHSLYGIALHKGNAFAHDVFKTIANLFELFHLEPFILHNGGIAADEKHLTRRRKKGIVPNMGTDLQKLLDADTNYQAAISNANAAMEQYQNAVAINAAASLFWHIAVLALLLAIAGLLCYIALKKKKESTAGHKKNETANGQYATFASPKKNHNPEAKKPSQPKLDQTCQQKPHAKVQNAHDDSSVSIHPHSRYMPKS